MFQNKSVIHTVWLNFMVTSTLIQSGFSWGISTAFIHWCTVLPQLITYAWKMAFILYVWQETVWGYQSSSNRAHLHLSLSSLIDCTSCCNKTDFGESEILRIVHLCVCTGIDQWLEHWTCNWKITGLNPCRSSRRNFFSRVDFPCWLLFRYPFHPHVTAVACKISWSFCQKSRRQVAVKHAYTLHMWLCMKWHGAWLYGVHRTCTETAAVSCGTSHASASLRWIFKKHAIKS